MPEAVTLASLTFLDLPSASGFHDIPLTCRDFSLVVTPQGALAAKSGMILPPEAPIQKRPSADPGSATGRPSPTRSARWGIASSCRVAREDFDLRGSVDGVRP